MKRFFLTAMLIVVALAVAVYGEEKDLKGEQNERHSKKAAVKRKSDLEDLRQQLHRAVPTANITVIPSSDNAVILTGPVERAEDVDSILQLAQGIGGIQVINAMVVGGVKQVQLDVVLASLNGISLSTLVHGLGGAKGQQSSLSCHVLPGESASPALTGVPSGPALLSLHVLPGEAANRLLGMMNLLKWVGMTRIIAQPCLVTLSGRPATFLVGGNQAVPVVGGIGGATGVQFEPFGTQVQFLPIVHGDGKIYMEVSPSITEFDPAFGTTPEGKPVAGRRCTCINTTVELELGQTFVIGGFTAARLPQAPTTQCRCWVMCRF